MSKREAGPPASRSLLDSPLGFVTVPSASTPGFALSLLPFCLSLASLVGSSSAEHPSHISIPRRTEEKPRVLGRAEQTPSP